MKEQVAEKQKQKDALDKKQKYTYYLVCDAMVKVNRNEQISIKNNIKIVDDTETKDEVLNKKVPQILNDIANLEIEPKSDIIAMHQIPGKQGFPIQL